MFQRPRISIVLAAVLVSVLGVPVAAGADQTFTVNFGYFAVRGEDARIDQDVLVENLNILAFSLRDFNNASISGEWGVELGNYLDVNAGVGYYRRTVPSVYRSFVNRDGSEIAQDLKLRIVPITATVRVLPLGRHRVVQPYVGGGIGIFNWRYSEVGEFVDFVRNNSVFRDRFVASGNATGPVAFVGIRGPVGSHFTVGGEIRYQQAAGRTGTDQGFLDERIDLGGYTSQFTLGFRF